MIVGWDANCFKLLVDALAASSDCASIKAIEKMRLDGSYIPLDDKNWILKEWSDCTGGTSNEIAQDWIAEQLASDFIRIIAMSADQDCRKVLTQAGTPRKDAKLVALMVSIGTEVLLSLDIDLYEPKLKGKCKEHQRKRLVEGRAGSVCKLIEKKFKLLVQTPENFCA